MLPHSLISESALSMPHSLRDGTHASTYQYKLPDIVSNNQTSEVSLGRLTSVLWQKSASGGRYPSFFFCDFFTRECGSTLYVGLARAIPPTNTNNGLNFLLTRLQEALYEDLHVYSIKFEVYHHFSGLRNQKSISGTR